MRQVVVTRTGVANLASVCSGLSKVGAAPVVSADPEEIQRADFVVLPGVGAFAAGMESLARNGLVEALRERIEDRRPTLCVCLGLQLLAKSSEESPGVDGIGIVDAHVGRFHGAIKVPQLGWNRVECEPGARLLQDGFAYFANSFRLDENLEGFDMAWSDHGGRFVAAFESGPFLACQFHPELSGAWGLDLLRRWLHHTPY